MAAMAKRTKYNLEKMPAPLFPASLDCLSDATGARIVDVATGESTIDGVVGPSSPTLFSATGSLFFWTIFAVSARTFWVAYKRDPPTINELTLDTPKDFEAPFPDFALTLSLEPRDFYVASQIRQIKAADGSLTWKEAEFKAIKQWRLLSEDEKNLYTCEIHKCDNRTLEYLWPVFRWESTSGGFVKKTDVHTLLGPEDGLHFGDDCGLNVSTISLTAGGPSSASSTASFRRRNRDSSSGATSATRFGVTSTYALPRNCRRH